jgi:hypothetical protein
MKARGMLRAVSIILFLFFLGHTAGTLLPTPSSGPAEDAAVGGMKSFHFDAMGSDRTLWDFWTGFGLTLSVHLLAFAVLAWQLNRRAAVDPAGTAPLVLTIGVAFAATAVLCWRYFFILPATFSTLAAILSFAAWASLRRTRPA